MSVPYDDNAELSADEQAARDKALGLDQPPVITGPGKYRSRTGLVVRIVKAGLPGPYSCLGFYADSRSAERWAASGRFSSQPDHAKDILRKARKGDV